MKFWLAFTRHIYRKGERGMMKRIWATVWATCMALTAALALAQTSEEIALAAYPSCTVKASASGNGFAGVEEHIPCHKGAYTGKSGITRDRTGKPWYYRNSKR